MNRKEFLVTSTLVAFSLSAFGKVTQNKSGNFQADCITSNDILGPFYRPNAPLRQDLLFDGLVGNKITIEGKVYSDDCKSTINEAMVEIWHCNTEGEYDNKSKAFKHRARWQTNKTGKYSFNTIMPGKYLNGKLYRPAHIHFRITAPGHQELISQIYFEGDPHIPDDPWASQKKAEHRILRVNPVDVKGGLTVYFDIFLQKK